MNGDVPDFGHEARELLQRAYLAQAAIRRFRLSEASARRFAERTLGHLAQRYPNPQDGLFAIANAIITLPVFFRRLEAVTPDRALRSESEAEAALSRIGDDCVFPHCTDVP